MKGRIVPVWPLLFPLVVLASTSRWGYTWQDELPCVKLLQLINFLVKLIIITSNIGVLLYGDVHKSATALKPG